MSDLMNEVHKESAELTKAKADLESVLASMNDAGKKAVNDTINAYVSAATSAASTGQAEATTLWQKAKAAAVSHWWEVAIVAFLVGAVLGKLTH